MMRKQSLRVALLSAALAAVSLTGYSRAADEPAPAPTPAPKTDPAPAPTPPPAQPGQRGNRGQFNPADMLKNFRDQFEGLNLNDDQMKKIDGFLETAEGEIKKSSEAGGDRRAGFQAFQKLNTDVQSVLTDAQKATLRNKQTEQRFDRMKTAYAAPELKLTDEQTAKIGGIVDAAKKEAVAMTPSGDADADRQKSRDLMRATRDKLDAVLTPDQKKLIPQFGGPNGRRGNRPPGGNNPPVAPPAPPATPPAI